MQESPSLREYAEHGTEDGVIPACVFVSNVLLLVNTTYLTETMQLALNGQAEMISALSCAVVIACCLAIRTRSNCMLL